MAQDIVGECLHVVGDGIGAALEKGVGAGGLGEGDARARRSTEADEGLEFGQAVGSGAAGAYTS